ncbi:hypothetical protein NC653_013408 [Populus alba x Populus x berolinensis]|uniref:Uncharacterized protein n=1 Tax=Populus alba x Populus x berolinensis TaxID=444605 RepID=A0AAD6QUV8_9ROSI|nr:hypothetical protein NC653_013408 [Populus alba x Populus x berolinensis]
MKSNIDVLGAGMMKFDKSRQICYSFHGYSSYLQEEEGWEMTQVLGGIFEGVLCRMGWETLKSGFQEAKTAAESGRCTSAL